MDPELEKKIKRVEPTKAESKRLYDQPLRVLRRGPDRKMKGFSKRQYRSEAEEIFFLDQLERRLAAVPGAQQDSPGISSPKLLESHSDPVRY